MSLIVIIRPDANIKFRGVKLSLNANIKMKPILNLHVMNPQETQAGNTVYFMIRTKQGRSS